MGTYDNETLTIFINAIFILAGLTAVLVAAAFVIVARERGTSRATTSAATRVVALPTPAREQRAA